MSSLQEVKLKAIADAIRTVEGTTGLIPAEDFANRILNLTPSSQNLVLPFAKVYYKSGSYYYPIEHNNRNPIYEIFNRTNAYIVIFIPKVYNSVGGTTTSRVYATKLSGTKINLGSKITISSNYISGFSKFSSMYHTTLVAYSLINLSPEDGITYNNQVKVTAKVTSLVEYTSDVTLENVINIETYQPSSTGGAD